MIQPGDTVYYIGGQDQGGRTILKQFLMPQLKPETPYKVLKTRMTHDYADKVEKWSLYLEGYIQETKMTTTKMYFADFMFEKRN